MSNSNEPDSETIATRVVNVGIEVFSVVMSFLTCGAFHIYSDLPGGENVGRTSFSQAIASIFGRRAVGEIRKTDGTSQGTLDS